MCLAVPGKVIQIDGNVATVDFFGLRRPVLLDVIDEPVAPGDYVLNHVGFAIRRIPAEEALETLALYEQLLAEDPGDAMAADVRGEIAATGLQETKTVPTRDEMREMVVVRRSSGAVARAVKKDDPDESG